MAHLHEVRDADTHFTIDAETMVITNTNAAKNKLRVGDHNSEVLTFEIPRYIENHDVLLCDKIGIHYMNAGTNKVDVSKDVYWVTDAAVSEEDENIVLFSWLVSGNATKYVGLLSFGIMFGCLEEDNTYSYVKNTEIFSGITISDGYNFTEAVVEQYSDVLKQEFDELEKQMEELTKELFDKLSEEIEKLPTSGGQPKPVDSASDITDIDTIYLYLGDGENINSVEYVKGYIYTYDTEISEWVNSGLYGKGQDGTDGEDGYSPTVTTTETDTGVSITVTNKDGSKSVEVKNGTATDEQVETYINAWLDEHPEATTTVENESLETAKYKDASVTPEKTSFFTGGAEQPEDLIGGFSLAQDWGTYPSKPMYVEDVNFLCVQAEGIDNNYLACSLVTVAEDGTVTKDGSATKINLYDNCCQSPTGHIAVFVLGGYTGSVKFNYGNGVAHIYKNSLPPLEKPTMLDDDLYKQGLDALYIEKPLWYLNGKYSGYVGYPKLVYKAENTEEKVKCYHAKTSDSSSAFVSIYDENWNLVETITGTQVYNLTVSGGIYYIYNPTDNGTATEEEKNFLGNEEKYNLWVQHGKQYGWVYLLTDKQITQVIENQALEDFVVQHREALTPRFTYVGELWDTNLAKYQAWSFNDLKWDYAKERMIMLIHDANSHGDGNATQCYLKEINPVTFENMNLPRIQVNGANIASYGFEILNDGTYITLASYNGGMRILKSSDSGQTWTSGDIIQEFTDNGMYSGTYHPFAMQKLSNGRLFVVCDSSQNEMFYSDDNGTTWLTATIPMGDITYAMAEPDLTELDDTGTVMMLARSSRAVDKNGTDLAEAIFSISYDYGATWETAQLSEIRCNCSDATALVHDGIVEVFASNKYCPVGGATYRITALVKATGFEGDFRRYYATVEEAKQNIWHYAGIMGFAQTTNPGYDMGSPCCCITPNGDIWAGFYDQADDGTSGKMLYRWFVAYKNGSYNFARGIQELAGKIAELSAS